jgi:hypothetical protein
MELKEKERISGDFDTLLLQSMFNETRVNLGGVADDGFPAGEDLLKGGRGVEVEV